MSAPTIDTTSVTTSSIPLTWTVPTGALAGGTGVTVDKYDLQVSINGGTFTTLSDTITGNTYTHTVTPGSSTYVYKIRAHNKYDWQDVYSATTGTPIVATSVPSQPSAPTIALEGTKVAITWSEPTTNQSPITAYRIKIQKRVGGSLTDFVENPTLCDGSQATVVSSRKCLIPMSALLVAPYSLIRGDTIYAKVSATNSRGESIDSAENTAGLTV